MYGTFTLDALNVNVTSILGKLLTTAFDDDTDVQATIYIKTSTLRSIFRFQTSATSIEDTIPSDALFYVDQTAFSRAFSTKIDDTYSKNYNRIINPVNAYLTNITGLNDNKYFLDASANNLVRADFVRYLAYTLTGSVYGVSMFKNTNEIYKHLGEEGHKLYYSNIVPAFQNAGTKSTPLTNNDVG
jgi:hypothetical protein